MSCAAALRRSPVYPPPRPLLDEREAPDRAPRGPALTPHSARVRLPQVWAPSALRASASPAPARSNGGGGAARPGQGRAIGLRGSRLRAPPPCAAPGGRPCAGECVRVAARSASALTQRRPPAAQRSAGLGRGPPWGPRALPDRGEADRGHWSAPGGRLEAARGRAGLGERGAG